MKKIAIQYFYKDFEHCKGREGCWDGSYAANKIYNRTGFFFDLLSSTVLQLVYKIDHIQ